jgi:hypothetical protein
MWVAAVASGDGLAKRETEEAAASKPHGKHTQDDHELLQQAHVRRCHH